MSDPSPSTLAADVSPEEDGERLDRWLARRFPEVSRARFQALIANGAVTVEGRPVSEARRKVSAGERIAAIFPRPEPAEPKGQRMPLVIVHEDDDLIVIDKPAGMIVHPGAGHADRTLVNALIAHCGKSLSGIGGVLRPGIVHRLDKDTSGLLVAAKNDLAHHGLSVQFAAHGRDGRLGRAYFAVIWGIPARRQGTVSAKLARSPANRQKMAVSSSATAREAITHYQIAESFPKPPAVALIRCRLETGRTHQIRVHMAHIGHPLLGDSVYGSGFSASVRNLGPNSKSALTSLGRQALHAAVLGFEHPRTGKSLQFESALPSDIAKLLDALREEEAANY